MLVTMEMAKLVLDAGFTAGRGAAAAKPRLDVVAKRFINEGRFPGPRYLSAGPELPPSADSATRHRRISRTKVSISALSSRGRRKFVAPSASSSSTASIPSSSTSPARRSPARGRRRLRCRRRSGDGGEGSEVPDESFGACSIIGIGQAVRAPRTPEHLPCLLRRRRGARHAGANKDKHFVASGIAWLINTARSAEQWGIKPGSKVAMLYERELAMCIDTMKKMHRRGIRVCIGGDYGFAWTPQQARNAEDIQTFVEMLGFSPMEAIQAATKYGGEIMNMGNELGMVREGYLADLLLVDRRSDRRCPYPARQEPHHRHREGRQFHEAPRMSEQRRRLVA